MTVLPVNQKWPWITPAEFRPELVPEELMAEGLSVRAPMFFKTLIIIPLELVFFFVFFKFTSDLFLHS